MKDEICFRLVLNSLYCCVDVSVLHLYCPINSFIALLILQCIT